MKRERLKIRFNKNNTISITFDAEGWEPIHTKIVEEYANRFNRDGTKKGSTIAELIGRALILEGKDADGTESYENFLDMLRVDIEQEEMEKQRGLENDPFS